jgi:hypothetical protein
MQTHHPESPKPLTIYLDSSDFSNLSDPQGDQEKARTIKNRLKSWVDSEQIEIRYSMTHIMEALPTADGGAEPSGLRLACIQELCGTKVMEDQITLITNELSNMQNPPTRNDEGRWLPFAAIKDEFLPDKGDATTLNRNQRRTLAAEMRRSGSRLDFSAERNELISRLPFKREQAEKVLKDPNNSAVLEAALAASLSDLSHLFAWHEDPHSQKTEFANILRQSGEGLYNLFIESAKQLGEYYRELTDQGLPDKSVDQQIKAYVQKLCVEAPQELANALSKDLVPGAQPVVADKDNAPTIFVLSKLLAHNLNTSVVPRKYPRVPKASDLGDVMHAMYLPYVDFFRADAATAHVINSQNFGFGATVVTSLDKLISGIEARLNGPSEPAKS